MPGRPTVAVIGAGPAGLTTSKSMLAAGLEPTLFDTKPVVGGLWANTSSTPRSMTVERRMRTNESKYTCSFSDFGWDVLEISAIDVRRSAPVTENEKGGKEWDMFPTAAELGRYLERYAGKFLHGKGCAFKLACEVTKIERMPEAGEKLRSANRPRWRVHYRDLSTSATISQTCVEEFDFLAICSGFNARAHIPSFAQNPEFKGDVLHTSEYSWNRVLQACSRRGSSQQIDSTRKHKIVVVGGSLSSAETAAEIGIEISSLPEEERERFELVHVFPRPFWVLPRYLPVPPRQKDSAKPTSPDDEDELHPPHFLPLDLILYDLRRRASSPTSLSMPERYLLANTFFKSIVDTDQSDYSADLAMTDEGMRAPPWVAVSDSYAGFVREGRIKTVAGRLRDVGEGGVLKISGTGREAKDSVIEDVDCLVLATGYTPTTSLRDVLPPDIFSAVTAPSSQDQDFTFLPLLLYNHCLHPSLEHSAGFVGLYKGPYFAGEEMQGRWLAALFAGTVEWPSDAEMERGIDEERKERDQRAETDGLERSHRSRGGYLDMVIDLCKRLGIASPDASQNSAIISPTLNISPLLPTHLHPSTNALSAQLTRFVSQISHPAHFIPIAVFRALHGKWSVSRIIASSTPSPMDGTFFGTAEFVPRKATFVPGSLEKNKSCGYANGGGDSDGRLKPIPAEKRISESATVYEYLYHEDGELTTNAGKVLSARRSYIYRLTLAPTPSISAYFVKRDRSSADYFFHEVEFAEEDDDGYGSGGGSTLWRAKGEHLCSADWYWPEYAFHFGGAELLDFEIGYKVKGPKKDYTTTATYWR